MDFVEVPKNHPTLPGGTDIYWDIGALFGKNYYFSPLAHY